MKLFLLNLLLIFLSPFFRVEEGPLLCSSREENQVSCVQTERILPEWDDPILVRICDFKDYRSIRTGRADRKGRYSYTYELFKRSGKEWVRISGAELLKNDADGLEARVNRDLLKEYREQKADDRLKDCLRIDDPRFYRLEEMGIGFSGNQLEIQVDHGRRSACFNVGHTILHYDLNDFTISLD